MVNNSLLDVMMMMMLLLMISKHRDHPYTLKRWAQIKNFFFIIFFVLFYDYINIEYVRRYVVIYRKRTKTYMKEILNKRCRGTRTPQNEIGNKRHTLCRVVGMKFASVLWLRMLICMQQYLQMRWWRNIYEYGVIAFLDWQGSYSVWSSSV